MNGEEGEGENKGPGALRPPLKPCAFLLKALGANVMTPRSVHPSVIAPLFECLATFMFKMVQFVKNLINL